MTDPVARFREEMRRNQEQMSQSEDLRRLTLDWIVATARYRYTYGFEWMGRPVIQFPQDLLAMQEIIWRTQPDLIIETGIAHGGSTVFYASMLQLLGGDRRVVGIDIEIRPHNRAAIESHPMAPRITMIEGSSVDETTVGQVRAIASRYQRVLVALDSNHTEEHVLRELAAYSPLVTPGSYLVVFDTIVEDMPADFFPDRPWSVGNNPKTAVRKFLSENDRFEVDVELERKLLITVAPEGYLRCVK
jgi:cephalosporin hydroxylase